MSEDFEALSVTELRQKAKEMGVKLGAGINKQGIVEKLRAAAEDARESAPAQEAAPSRPVRSAVLITDDEMEEDEDDIPVLTPNPALTAAPRMPRQPVPTGAAAPAASSLSTISAKAPAFTMEGSRAWHNPRAYQAPAAQRHTPAPSWNTRPAAGEKPYARPGVPSAGESRPQSQPAYPVRFGPADPAPQETSPRMAETHAPYAQDYQPRQDYQQPRQDYPPRQDYQQPRQDYPPRDAYHPQPASGPSIAEILAAGECGDGEGVLDVHPDGYGFLRANQYRPGKGDVYIANAQIRRFSLRSGDYVVGKTKPQKDSDRFSAMLYITEINGRAAEETEQRPRFEELTAVYPTKRLTLHAPRATDGLMRQIDLLAPIGLGQRALLTSPAGTNRLELLKQLAVAVDHSHSKAHLMVLLVDQRPEDITWFRENAPGEVVCTSFDQPAEIQSRVVELAMERAMRLAEEKKDVVVLADSLNRICRVWIPLARPQPEEGASPTAVTRVKKFLGIARCLKEGGSVTLVATAEASDSRPDHALINEVRRYINCTLDVNQDFTALNQTASRTEKSELILSQKDQDEAIQLRDDT